MLLQCLTLQFRIDLCVLHKITFSDLDWNCFRLSFTPLGTIFSLPTSYLFNTALAIPAA